jgi:hypothetical protein
MPDRKLQSSIDSDCKPNLDVEASCMLSPDRNKRQQCRGGETGNPRLSLVMAQGNKQFNVSGERILK